MPSSSRLKGKAWLEAWLEAGWERWRRRPLDHARENTPPSSGAGGASAGPGQGGAAERELEEEEEEEVEEEEREGPAVREPKGPGPSSGSRAGAPRLGTGVQGCQPGATEQDFMSWGLQSSGGGPWALRYREEPRWKEDPWGGGGGQRKGEGPYRDTGT